MRQADSSLVCQCAPYLVPLPKTDHPNRTLSCTPQLADISADVGVSVARIIGEVGIQQARASTTSAFDAPSAAAAAGAAPATVVVVPIRRKAVSAPVSQAVDASASEQPVASAASTDAAELPLAGTKRAREGEE